MATMKAAVFIKPNSPLEIQDVPIPKPGDRDILIKVSAASLCHSDFMVLDGTYPVSAPGTILGHEACGTITAVGPIAEKRGFKVGERVGSVCWYGMCMDCHACTNYGPQYCANKKMMGFVVNGFFAEYALLDVESAVKVPEGADMSSLAPVFCAGVTVWDGLNQISAPKGSWIAYVGCGGLGHLGIQYAAKLGYKVVGIDIHDDQLELVRSLGASHTFNSRTEGKDLAAKIAKVTGPPGLSAVVVTSAAQQAYRTAMDIIGIKGQIIATGLPNAPLPIFAGELCFKYVELKPCLVPGPISAQKCVDFTCEHNLMPHITKYKLDDINTMIDLMRNDKTTGRMVVVF